MTADDHKPPDGGDYHILDPEQTDPKRIRREREKARALRKSQWWRNLIGRGRCHYCDGRFRPQDLTMDHVVPLARGGSSTRGNLVPACADCNREKKLSTPAEDLMKTLEKDPPAE